ncbi:MAG: hypothetical protein ACM31C_03590 [Acidobacteriota bacterium]
MRYALLVVLVACRSHDKPAPKAPPPDPLAAVLVNAGAEPRRPVHYALAKGTKVELDLAIDAHLAIAGISPEMPEQQFVLEVVVDDVLADGRMQLRSTIVHAAARDGSAGSGSAGSGLDPRALAGRLAMLEGTAITATLSPDGRLDALALDDGGRPQPDAAELLAGFGRLAIALPKDPIGVGARWTSSRELTPGGVRVTATSTFDVTALAADKLSYRVTTELHGADQQATMQGVAIDVAKITGSGSGDGTLDLAHFANQATLELKLAATMTAQGEASPLELGVKTVLAPREGASR